MSITDYLNIAGEMVDHLYAGFEFNPVPFRARRHDPKYSVATIGPSGAGKHGRGEYLVRTLGLEATIGSGDIFRTIASSISKDAAHKIKHWGNKHHDKREIRIIANDDAACDGVYNHLGINNPLTSMQKRALLEQLNGLFVDDDIVFHYARDQISKYRGTSRGINLDGHLRTGPQIEGICDILEDNGSQLSAVLLVHAPLALLQTRTVGRLKCKACNTGYNTESEDQHPLGIFVGEHGLKWGYCSKDRQLLARREDDFPDKVANRLSEYKENIRDVLAQLHKRHVPVYVVSGTLTPYSQQRMEQSIEDSLQARSTALSYF